ncbi:hypothetical protein B2I19_00015 [Thermoplasmatales archaeon ARMAN]|nr:MAG: hypothetical protein B2I19_00015 [Thermoplasmatales archaeon ARMAN]
MALSISSAQALGTANYNSIVPSQANNQNQNGIGNTYPNGLAYPENELSSMYSNLFNKSMIKGINSHFLANISKNLVAYGIGQSFQNGSYVYKINAVYPKNGDINSIGNETFSLRIIKPIVGSDGSVILKSNSAYIPSMIKVPIIYNGSNLLLNLSVKLDSSYKNEITDIVLSKTPPPNLESRFSGTPYYYIHVNSSINDTNVIDANYTFAVNKSWINSQNISPGQVALYKYVGGKWMEMPTLLIGNNSTAYFYDGESDSLSDYVISYSTGSATGSANPLSVTLPAGYKLYLCDAGANYTFSTTAANSWTALQNATSPSSPPPAASVGYQTNNVCTAYTPAIKGRRNAYTVGLAVAGIGLNITNYNFYGASANSSTTASLTYPVTVNGSFVAILVASGYYGLTGLPTVPSGCSIQQITTNATSYESAYISTCNNVQKGSYNATASNGDGGATVIGSFVFPPGNVILDDNPTGAGSIFTNNKTYTNGQNSLLLGKGEISAKPANNFVFTNWSVSNANLTVQNAYAQTTNLTVVGNGILTANYNGITTFSESGLPSGATWSVVYDGITNSSALSSISFDTVPGSHTFAIANVTYNGKTYIAKPSSGSVVAGNVTSVAFSEEGVLSLVVSSNRTAYDTSDIVTATAPLPSQSIEILIGQGTAKGVLVSSGTGSASCNLYSTCNANVPLAAGLYNVSAYLPSTGNVISEEVNITKASPSLTLSVPNSYVYDGSGGTIDFGISSYNNQLQGTLYVNNASVASTFSSNTYTTSASVGNYSIAFKTSGNVNYTSASRTGKFSIYPKLYTVNYTSAGAVGTTDTLSVSTSTGYDIYLCDGGTSYGTLTYTTGTIDLSNTYSYIGNQTTNTCTETTTGPDLAEAILGVKALHTYTLYDSSGTATDSFTYNVVKNDSFVAIMLSSGYYGLSSAPTVPSGCIEKVYDTGGDTYESSYIAICQSQIAGQYTVSSSSTLGGYITAGAYVFSPYQLVLDDNPIAGTITTNGKTFANGQTTNVIGTGTITANPPKNFVFTNWGVSNANLTVQNAYAQTTNLTVVGNGILTANYNGITTFSESGLPSGATWSVVYDGITNSSALSSISFDTVPGSHTFAIANVTYNGKTYIAKPSSGSVVAGNVTSVAFSEEGVLSLVVSSNRTAYDTSDIVTATAPLPSQSIEILIGQGTAKGVLVSSGTGSASCNLYSTCNANVPLAAGLYNVSAYLPSTGNVISEEVNITKASPSLTLSVPNSYVYDGSGGTIDFGISSYNNQLQGTLYVNNASVASTFSSNTYTTSASVGNYSIAFKTSGNVNYTSASRTGKFSIYPKLYTVNYTSAGAVGTTDTLSVSTSTGYDIYLCDGGTSYGTLTYTTGTIDLSNTYSYIGNQTTNTCTETTTGPDLAEAILGVKALHTYTLYDSSGTATDSFTYNVVKNDSFVAIMLSSGYYGLSSAPTVPSGCIEKVYDTGGDTYESSYIAICQSQIAGQYTVSSSSTLGGYITAGAYVFSPYQLVLDDNPIAGTITTNGKTFANGQTTNVIGTGTITANPPKNFVFTNWGVSNANLTVQNAYAQTTNLTVVGNGILTANYNGITTFSESGLPSGATWSVVYDGITNSSALSSISFDTVPGSHTFAIANVTYNGKTYIAKPSSGSVVAGNVTSVAFSEEGVLSLVVSSNRTAYDTSDIVTATAPLPSQSIEILIGQGTAKGVLVSSGTGSASCNLYSTCNANVPLAAGLYNVSAYLPSTGNVISEEVNITKASPSLTLSVPNSYVYDGSGGTIDFGISSYNNQLQGTLYVNNASVASTFSSNTYTTSASVGNYSIAFKTSGNVNYTSASRTGKFSIYPKLYTVNYTSAGAVGTTDTLSVSTSTGYDIYLCDGGTSYGTLTYTTGTIDLSNTYSYIGNQTTNTCTETTTGPDLAEAILGVKALHTYTLYDSSGTATDSFTYNVVKNDSFVAIMLSSGYYGLSSAPTVPSGCIEKVYDTGGDTYESSYIAICQSQIAGQYTVSSSSTLGGYITAGAYVFSPYQLVLDDNPIAGTITTNGKTFANGQTTNVIGTGTITANPPKNFVFTNWGVSNANLTVQNAYAQTTNLTVVGNGILTANYNGITTFSESGLPSGATWSVVYDGITNSSALSSISFDTVPGSHTFAIANVTYNGKTYIAKPSSGSVVAGNVTSVAFSEEGVLSLVVSSNRTAYDTSDIVTATAPLPSQSIEILIGQGTAKGVLVSSGTGSASCNLYSTCNANVPLAAGLYNVSAYLPSTGNVISEEVNITKASPSLTLSVPNSYVYDGSGGTIDFGISSYNNQLQGTLYVNNASVASTFSSNTYTTSASVGNYSIAFKTSGNVNYTSASRTGKFSIYPKLYTVNYTSAGAVGTTDTLSVSTSTGYDIYLCDGGTSYGTLTYTTGTIDLSNTYSYIGNQTTNTCTETTTGPDLAEAILGVKALHTYTLYDSSGTATDSFTYNVVKNDSFVAIMLSSGYYGLSSAPTVPSGCIEKVYDTGGDTYESSYIAICQSQIAGQYTVSSSSTLGGYITAGAYVFSPYQLVLDDNPIAGTITTNGKTFANGQTTNVIGTGTITANPPKNFVFTNWGVSNANLTVQNAYAQTTNLTVVGNGILTASYNGITTFSESGLPSGAPWSVVYDGITNSSALSSISFDTAPGSYTFAIANVTYNGKTYIAKPSSGSVVAGNVTSVAFSEEGVLSLVLSSNKTAYDISDIVTARAPLPSQSIEILIGQGTAKGVLVSSGTGSASCNLYSTCNANVPLAAGLYNVSAYLPSTGNVISEEVNITKASPSLTLSVPNSYVYDGSGGTIDFGISSYNNQLQGTLYVNNASVASTFSSNTYTTSASVGNYSIAFKTSGNVNYTSASKTGNFSIAPKLYTVNSTEALNSSTTDTLTAYAHANYLTYICDGGAGTAAVTYTTGTVSQYSGGDDSYIGEQTTDACTETTTGPDLAEAAAGVYAKPSYSLYKGSYTYGGTLDYKVNETGSLVVVAISSGGGEISGIPSALSGCYSKGIESGSDGLESAYIAICQDQKAGSYSIAESVSSGENFAMAAYVFPPYALTMDDNPVAGTITTNGKTFANGQTTNVIGTGTITANPPKNFVFTNWSVSNANLTVQNAYAQTTNLTVVGNGILTASYNGITTFYESGLPSGTLWNLTYDGFKNASTGNYISFDTVPGPHSYAVGNVLINGYNYTPSVYSSTLTAGNTTIIKFTPPVCTISLNTNTISFGNLDPGTIYPDSVQIIDTNSGDATANILLSGTNWTNPTINFGATNTSWSITSLSSFGPNLLSRSPRNTAISIGPSSSNSIYFGLNVPGAIPAGTYTQTIVIENSC